MGFFSPNIEKLKAKRNKYLGKDSLILLLFLKDHTLFI